MTNIMNKLHGTCSLHVASIVIYTYVVAAVFSLDLLELHHPLTY